MEQEREDEQPISTMKQDENKFDKTPTPKCDIELPEKIAYPSEKAVGQNENFTASQREVIKPKKRSTSNILWNVSHKFLISDFRFIDSTKAI